MFLNGILRLLISREFVDADFTSAWTGTSNNGNGGWRLTPPKKSRSSAALSSAELERFVEYLGKSPVQVIAGDWSQEVSFGCRAVRMRRNQLSERVHWHPRGRGEFPRGIALFFHAPGERQERRGREHSLERLLVDRAGYISSLFWYGNPRAALTGGKYSREALDKVPLIVHLSSYHNETCEHAHVSIPMSSWLEYDGLLATSNGRAIQCHKKVVDPPGQCRSPLEFWTDLAGAIGLSLFGEGAVANGNAVYDSLLRQNPLTSAITFAGLDPMQKSPGILWPCTDPSQLSRVFEVRKRHNPGAEYSFSAKPRLS